MIGGIYMKQFSLYIEGILKAYYDDADSAICEAIEIMLHNEDIISVVVWDNINDCEVIK